MTTLREAAQQALETLEKFVSNELTVGQRYTNEGEQMLASIYKLRTALAEQPAIQCTYPLCKTTAGCSGACSKAAPQPAKREPLTDEEIDAVMRKALGYGFSPSRDDLDFVRAVERAHGIGGGV